MVDPKKFFLALFCLIALLTGSLFPPLVFASRSEFYDFGPYYSEPRVLGLSLSSLENLPAPKIPDELIPPAAKGVLPGTLFYPFEKGIENIQLAITFDPIKKEELRLQFAQERLSEAKTLVDQGKIEAAAEAMDGYGKTVSVVAQTLTSLAQKNNPAAKTLAEIVEKRLAAQAVFTQSVMFSSSPAQAENWIIVSEASNKALDKAAEAKGAPAMPEELATGIQKLKEEGLISEEESSKLYSLKSRSEVREEIDKLTSSGQFPPSEAAKLDTTLAKKYPDMQKRYEASLQVAELRTYQTLPRPSKEVLKEMEKWQKNPTQTPPNGIKPYLWFSRAQDLARNIDLSSYSSEQQVEVAKFYPETIAGNSTYSPLPSPISTPSPSPSPAQNTTNTPVPSPTAVPTPPSAEPYLGEVGGVLPGDTTYFIKRLGEQVSQVLTFDPTDKAKLSMQYAERRLAESAALAKDPQKAALYENIIKSYKSAVEDSSNYLKKAGDSLKTKQLAKKLESQAGRHEIVLEKGLLPPPAENPKLISEVIKVTEDVMDRSADAQGKPALPAVLASRLGDLKAQGLVLPEEVDDLIRSGSREEVRSKIRKLSEQSAFPPADAKKLDETQALTAPSDYNQLVEVRKVEELQNLRAVQTEFAQTPTLKSTAAALAQQETVLLDSIEPALIKEEDLKGREDLVKTYQKLASKPQPINGGQFGADVKVGASPSPAVSPVSTPRPADAVLSTCPVGAVFKQFEGCVWADSGKKLNDFDQYKCKGPRQYYSFAARKCVPYESGKSFGDDAQPTCPVGYNWAWQTQYCQAFTGGGPIPLPTPKLEPEPKDDKQREERSKSCPAGSTYKSPDGCVWDQDGKKVYDSSQYRCGLRSYYSFEQHKCVPSPKAGEEYSKDAYPACKNENSRWSWSEGKCVPIPDTKVPIETKALPAATPFLATPESPIYFIKQWGETVQSAVAFTAEAKQQIRISQARERLTEGLYALEKGHDKQFTTALSSYTARMQEVFNDLSKTNLSGEAKKSLGERLSKEAVEQNLLLQKASVLAENNQDNAIAAAVSSTILGIDKAADLKGEAPIPADVKEKIEALPEKMISEEQKKKLLETGSRVEVRLRLGSLISSGGLVQEDTTFLNEDLEKADSAAKAKLEELKKLEKITVTQDKKEEITGKVEKNEKIVAKLADFEKTFEEGDKVPTEIRPYVRLTRINEVAQTIRPDIVKLGDFSNRKDVVLAVATLQEEFRPTKQAMQQVEDFKRRNPNAGLPPELARIEALSFSLGVRGQAGPCFLPSPPFPANTPCPAPGAAIPITSYSSGGSWYSLNYNTTPVLQSATDKDGKPLVYGQGPQSASPGVCPSGYHWMYDSGGWCMSDSGGYGSSYNYTPTGTGAGYTPYSPYYTAPGAPPASFGFQVGDNSPNDGCSYGYDSDGKGNCIPNSYPASSYSPPSYYGVAPSYYTTTPPAGTVPGSGPRPTAPGSCPTGFHWMSDSGGWCMSDGPTYVPSGGSYTTGSAPPSGGYNCGSQPYDPVTKRCKDGACPGGFNWDGSKCVAGNYCQPPSSGCGSSSYWDYGSCSCRSSSSYYGGSSPTQSNYCQGLSCGGGTYLDYSTCSCKYSSSGSSSGTSTSGTGSYCSPPAGGCGSGWFDSASCSCKQASSQGCYNVSASSCGSGWYWDSSACTCRQSTSTTSSTTSSGGGTSSGGSSSGSCPSGYHWMSDNGGWCMSDGGSSPSTSGTTSSSPTPAPATTEPAPASTPAPTTSETAPAPAQSQPAPTPAESSTTPQ